MNKLIQLQSGFITPYESHLNKNVAAQRDDVNTAVKLTSSKLPAEWSEFYYSPVIDKLFKRYLERPGIVKTFMFKDEVITLALGMFLKDGLLTFITNQSRSELVSDRHFSFLEDILNFVLYSKQSVSMINWVNLIEPEAAPLVNRNIDYSKVVCEGDTKNLIKALDSTIDVMKLWLEKDGGLEHLLITMKIIFGNTNRPLVGA